MSYKPPPPAATVILRDYEEEREQNTRKILSSNKHQNTVLYLNLLGIFTNLTVLQLTPYEIGVPFIYL